MDYKTIVKNMVLVVGILCMVSMLCSPVSAACIANQDPHDLVLINTPRVQDGTTFVLYVVVLSKTDSPLSMNVKLPNGFHLEADAPPPRILKAYEPQIVALTINVKNFVAEQDHLIRVEMTNNEGEPVSSAETSVNVWWDWTKLST